MTKNVIFLFITWVQILTPTLSTEEIWEAVYLPPGTLVSLFENYM